MNNKHSIQWKAHEYFHQEKNGDWYWGLGIVSITASIIAILLGNILFALVILIFAFTAGLLAHRPARILDFELNTRGVVIDHTLYPYTTLESFSISDLHVRSTDAKILIKSKKFFMPFLHVPLGDIDPEEARLYLLRHLDEEEHDESILEKVMEYYGF